MRPIRLWNIAAVLTGIEWVVWLSVCFVSVDCNRDGNIRVLPQMR